MANPHYFHLESSIPGLFEDELLIVLITCDGDKAHRWEIARRDLTVGDLMKAYEEASLNENIDRIL